MPYDTTHTPHRSADARPGSPAGSTERPMRRGVHERAAAFAGSLGARAGALPGTLRGALPDEMPDFRRAGVFGAGLAVGALLGAGVALLLAPQSGEVTRSMITRRARDLRADAGDAWFDLGEELRAATRRKRRDVRRRMRRARWAAADMVDR